MTTTPAEPKLAQVLCCNVCMEQYILPTRKPLILSCCHTFCAACLEHLARPLRCPVCSTQSATEPGVNYALLEVLEAAASSNPQCQLCRQGQVAAHDAEYRCLDCPASTNLFCKRAGAYHPPLHRVVSSADAKAARIVRCTKPDHDDMRFYCIQDQCLICVICLATAHHGHKCMSVHDAYLEKKPQVAALVQEAEERVAVLVQSGTRVGGELEKLELVAAETKGQIGKLFTAHISALTKRMTRLKARVDSLAKEKRRLLQQQHGDLTTTAKDLSSAAQHMQQVLVDESEASLLLLERQLKAQLAAVGERKLAMDPVTEALLWFIPPPEAALDVAALGEVSDGCSSPACCVAEGEGLLRAVPGAIAQFTITARNQQEQVQSRGGESFQVEIKGGELKNLADQRDGKYEVSYWVPDAAKGDISIGITLHGVEIKGSPFNVQIDSVAEAKAAEEKGAEAKAAEAKAEEGAEPKEARAEAEAKVAAASVEAPAAAGVPAPTPPAQAAPAPAAAAPTPAAAEPAAAAGAGATP